MKYQPFFISVEERKQEKIRVEAQFMGIKHSHIMSELPFTKKELSNASDWLESGRLDTVYAQELGQKFFDFIFRNDVKELLYKAENCLGDDEGLRLVLQLPKTKGDKSIGDLLQRLPWELMYDKNGKHGYLAQSLMMPLVHHNPSSNIPNRPPGNDKSLRVLIITANPKGSLPLKGEQEVEQLVRVLSERERFRYKASLIVRHIRQKGTLKGLKNRFRGLRRFEVVSVFNATKTRIKEKLREARCSGEPFHIIHFIGHGEFKKGKTYLLLHDDDDSEIGKEITGEDFVDLVIDKNLIMLFISACQSASVAATSDIMPNVAQQAQKRGIPVVVGMRMNVLDEAAFFFARDFYASLAAGEPVEAALSTARHLIRRETSGQEFDWSIPLLFMGSLEGLTLPVMQPHRLTLAQRAWRGFAGVITILGIVGTLVGIPALGKTVAREVPGIKCLALYPMDENKFTVAFYPFSVVKANDHHVLLTDDGRDLAQFLYNRFERSFEDLNLDIPFELMAPAHACAIRGKDPKARVDKAAQIAERINADIIIYGTISDADKDPRLTLEFHVSHHGFSDGEEITGPYALGNELPVDLPFDPKTLLPIYRPAHLVYTDVMSAITVGLIHYSADDFQNSLLHLRNAEQIPQWAESDGKEIIHLLLGNALLRMGSREKGQGLYIEAREHFQEAREHYQKALEIEPDFTRAKVGEANAIYLLAWEGSKFEDVREYMIDNAERKYIEALSAAEASEDQTSIFRIRFCLGQIALVRAVTYDLDILLQSDYLQQAEKYFESVIMAFEQGNESLSYQASHAYKYLGNVQRLYGYYDQALPNYEEAIVYASPLYKVVYGYELSRVYCEVDEYSNSTNALLSAIDTARVFGYADFVDDYMEKMDILKTNSCADFLQKIRQE